MCILEVSEMPHRKCHLCLIMANEYVLPDRCIWILQTHGMCLCVFVTVLDYGLCMSIYFYTHPLIHVHIKIIPWSSALF